MRYLVVSDVHSNLEALQAVIRQAESLGGFDAIWSLGDIVGYGANPNGCLDLLRSYPLAAVSGNHDLAVAEAVSVECFNDYAKEAVLWTREQLTADHMDFLKSTPVHHEEANVTLLHGTPNDPIWEYFLPQIMAIAEVAYNFRRISTKSCLVGHSHLPLKCTEEGAKFIVLKPMQKQTLLQSRCVGNPGSVGQPRDGDPRAAYALYDTDSDVFVHYRVAYAVVVAQAKIVAAGLPSFLATRLANGR